MQAQLTNVLGLQRTNSRISLMSIASFVEDTNTPKAYKKFCKKLHEIGITEDLISQKEPEILEILRSENKVASSSQILDILGPENMFANSQIGGSQLLGAGCCNSKTLLHTFSH